jgi:Icc-related predicted phosphoesterase
MKITCISDSHCHHKKIIMPETDMIIHAGDFTYHGEIQEVTKFLKWFGEQKAEHKILICGNHEVEISKHPQLLAELCENEGIRLLRNQHYTVERYKIFGSPYTPTFGRGWAYMMDDQDLIQVWDMIDNDVDILITHGPAYKRLDLCPGGHVGSKTLLEKITNEFHNLKLHVTGHIHESRGTALHKTIYGNYMTVNAAICGIPYTDLIINPITVEL